MSLLQGKERIILHLRRRRYIHYRQYRYCQTQFGRWRKYHVSYGSICIDHSVVNINTVANNIALAAINGLSISNSSQVTVESNGNASAVYTPQDLTISDSILKADSSQISVRNKGAMRIINSTVEAICNGDPITESLYSEDTISIEGNSNVLAIGKISAVNGVSVVPSSEHS